MSLTLMSLLVAGAMTSGAEPAPPIPAAAASQSAVRSVPVGDPQRRVLLDTIRPAIASHIGQPVQFMVDRLQVQGDWAFYAGRIQQPSGRPIDFSRTRYAEAMQDGMFDGPNTYALLRRKGTRWRLVDWVVGPTDVTYAGWSGEYGAPESLFE